MHLITLDLEASSLDEHSYPIEVAFVAGTADGIVTQFSTLIKPRPEWRSARGWSAASQKIHGIGYDELASGMDAATVCDILNAALAGKRVSVDGGSYDDFWLERLFAGRERTFQLDHLAGVDSQVFMAAKRGVAPQHRALPDATWLWQTLLGLRSSTMP